MIIHRKRFEEWLSDRGASIESCEESEDET